MLKIKNLPHKLFSRQVKLKQWTTEWFYSVDQKGLLYLDETEPKNYTSCLKDDKFLNFFFKTLKKNDTGLYAEFPWLSICWGEYGFVRSDRYPIVFHTLLVNGGEGEKLIYGGTLGVDFDPKKLLITPDGVLYHPIPKQKNLGMGMLSSNLLMNVSDKIHDVGNGEFVWKSPVEEVPIQVLENEQGLIHDVTSSS